MVREESSLRLSVVSLRYSSWSMRPWLALTHAGAKFVTDTAPIDLGKRNPNDPSDAAAEREGAMLAERRKMGSVTGLFPALQVGDATIHESLAICEWANDAFPAAGLWPEDALARARARAISCEMLCGFTNVRTHLSCHLFGRLASPLKLDPVTEREVARVFELWREALSRSGGPFLFGRFTIADCMYYPMRTRFRSYGVLVPADLEPYTKALDESPPARALVEVARAAPRVPAYDDYLRGLGGDPDAALHL
ncbi:MAG: glutathione S-transferase [Labilithrix sp.]